MDYLLIPCLCLSVRGFRGWVVAKLWWRSTWPFSVTWSQHRPYSCVLASRWWSPTSLPVCSSSCSWHIAMFRKWNVESQLYFRCWSGVSLHLILCISRGFWEIRCSCLFSERVTICEGGVDISDSDDEDESMCQLFTFKFLCIQTIKMGGAFVTMIYIKPT